MVIPYKNMVVVDYYVRKNVGGGEGCQVYSKTLNASEIQLPLGDVEMF